MNNFFNELKRRNVVRVAIAYAVVGWVILQVVELVSDIMNFPESFPQMTLVALLIGYPIVLFFSWAYEVTPEGVKKTKEVDKSKSITHGTGQRINKLIAGALVLALGFIVYDQFIADDRPVRQAEAGQASIAVLPFTNMSGLQENEQFTNGLHDDLLTQLSKIESLKVISRTSVLEYRDTTKSMPQIGNELGVTTLIEGGIQRAGNRVRINVQLINASTDEHIWAETYDRELTVANIFDVQTEIARNITDQLNATFNPEEEARIAEVPTDNLEAYEAYLEGMAYGNEIVADFNNGPRAEEAFKRAIELDPEFAQAWAGLSKTYMAQYWWSNRLEERRFIPMAKEMADKALEIHPGLADGHEALGVYFYWGLLDYEKSVEEFNKAIEGGVRTPQIYSWRGSAYRRSGMYWDEALADFQRGAELDPRDPTAHWALGGMYAMLRRIEDGQYHLQKSIELDPDSFNYRSTLANIYFYYSNDPRKVMELTELPQFTYDLYSSFDYSWLMVLSGEYQRVVEFYEKVEERQALSEYGLAWTVWGPQEKGMALEGLGRLADAQVHYLTALARADAILEYAPDYYEIATTKSLVLLLLGRLEEGLELAREIRAIKTPDQDALANLTFELFLIMALAANDEIDEAIERLDVYLSYPHARALGYVLRHPFMRNIQTHEDFPALIEKYGLAFRDQSQGVGQ